MDEIQKYLENQAKLSAKSKQIKSAPKISDLEFRAKTKKHSSKKVKKRSETHNLKEVSEENQFNEKINNINDLNEVKSNVSAAVRTENYSGSEYFPSGEESDGDMGVASTSKKVLAIKKSIKVEKYHDDGSIDRFQERIKQWKLNKKNIERNNDSSKCDQGLNHDTEAVIEDKTIQEDYHRIEKGFKVPNHIWDKLFRYQKTGVKWLWELHQIESGGLLGDEMGLGKTVQVIAFLAGLSVSGGGFWGGLGPCIVVAPATVMHQWVQHFHRWWPPLRVAVLHQSGSFTGPPERLVRDIHNDHGILVTTYAGITKHKTIIEARKWHYIILDEGHKIRNSDTQASKVVKKIRTPHRIVVTGSPMQNNLQELWSLFDFMSPGLLGTLPAFLEHFANPITQGGYTNASQLQETNALSLAIALKNTISPYLLRRTKVDVKNHLKLPDKSEQVLFCSLSDEQKDLYKSFLCSASVRSILDKEQRYGEPMRARILVALITLRKICNHPDLYVCEVDEELVENGNLPLEQSFGFWRRSGKMVVINSLLKIWKKQGHRVLIFTQSRAMILVIEHFLQQNDYKYLKMDGGTSIGARQPLITKFNEDPSHLVFLATTRVGGLGVNLTGADRVIIYDPDWNPATDSQAKERAWRIGQLRNVTVYRLLCAGTIEEKIYQRQVFKQLLSNKVLLDPNQKNFLKTSTLQGLFSLEEPDKAGSTETTNIFKHSKVQPTNNQNSKNNEDSLFLNGGVSFSKNKMDAMRRMAQEISKTLTSKITKVKEDAVQQEDPRERYKRKMEPPAPPPEPPQINVIDEQETTADFGSVLSEIDIVNMYSKPEPLDFLQLGIKGDEDDDEKINVGKSDELSDGEIVDDALENIDIPKSILIDPEKVPYKIKKIKKDSVESPNCVASVNVVKKESKCVKLSKKSESEDIINKRKKRKREKVLDKFMSENDLNQDEDIMNSVRKVKCKKPKVEADVEENHDQYVLDKLFAKSGVQSALQHDQVVGLAEREERHRMRTEAQHRAMNALKALRKSRVKNWRW